MNKTACKYAVLRFMPYPETGEFANVGVVIMAPKLNKFLFKLEGKTRRLTTFFKHLDKNVYLLAVKGLEREMIYWQERIENNETTAAQAFDFFVKPRATVLGFNSESAIMVPSVENGLDLLFENKVQHGFANQANYERTLKTSIKNYVGGLKLDNPFGRYVCEDKGYKVQFDLAQLKDDKLNKIIKPLFFDLDDTKKIYDHADGFLPKLNRLKGFDLLPKDFLFTVEEPINREEAILDAWALVRKDLENFGEIVQADNKGAIKDFALAH